MLRLIEESTIYSSFKAALKIKRKIENNGLIEAAKITHLQQIGRIVKLQHMGIWMNI